VKVITLVIKIAIVGAEENKWKPEQKVQVKNIIITLLTKHAFRENTKILPYANTSMEVDWSRVVLVSGRCPEGGVDIWAEEIADELGIKKEIYAPEVNQWNDKTVYQCEKCGFIDTSSKQEFERLSQSQKEYLLNHRRRCGGRFLPVVLKGYRSRNIQIAEACDVLYNIEPARSCLWCKGTGKKPFPLPKQRIERNGYPSDKTWKEIVCHKCEGDGAYSGGTWTYKYARKLGKEVHKIIL